MKPPPKAPEEKGVEGQTCCVCEEVQPANQKMYSSYSSQLGCGYWWRTVNMVRLVPETFRLVEAATAKTPAANSRLFTSCWVSSIGFN